MADIEADQCRMKAEDIIHTHKPFILIAVEDDTHSSFLIHVGGGTPEQRSYNRKHLDYLALEFTKQIHPMVKMAWVMSDMQKGDPHEEG